MGNETMTRERALNVAREMIRYEAVYSQPKWVGHPRPHDEIVERLDALRVVMEAAEDRQENEDLAKSAEFQELVVKAVAELEIARRPTTLSDEHRKVLEGLIEYASPGWNELRQVRIDALTAALSVPPPTVAQRFADYAISISSEGGIEDGDLQEDLVKFGLLKKVEVTESCGESCACAGYDDGFPLTCYKRTTEDVPGFDRGEWELLGKLFKGSFLTTEEIYARKALHAKIDTLLATDGPKEPGRQVNRIDRSQ